MPRKRNLQGDTEEIIKAMKSSKNPSEYRRMQSVYLGLTNPQMSIKKIGEITQYSESRVKAIYANYRREGLVALNDRRGGRYHENMSFEQEVRFLEPFENRSQTGSIAVVGEIKKAYEAEVGKEVSESTIYRLLARHEFRKIVPYKRHKKADVEAQEAFKKTSLQ